ncbi:MAG: transglycosylase family protein [Solirubrobacterales bacterium]
MKRLVLAGTIVPALLCAAFSAPAQGDVDDLESDAAAAKQRIEKVSASLGEGRTALDSAQEKASAAAARADEMNGLIATGAQKSATLEEKVAGSEAQLERSRERLKRAERLLAERLVAIYMSGSPDSLDLLLGAADYGDLATGNEYLEALQNADVRLASRVRSVRNEFEDRTDHLTALKARVDEHNAELAAAQAGIEAARAAAAASAIELASINTSREGEIGELKSDINGLEKKIEKEQAAAAAAEEEADVPADADEYLGGPYSIPTYIVMCESGGDYSALNPSGAGGAYQIMPATWEAYGGTGLPNEASKAEQDRIAALIYADSGTAPWVCG